MDVKQVKREVLLKEWAEEVSACRNSGMPINQWCDENGMNVNTYYRHQREVRNAACDRLAVYEKQSAPAFAELTPVSNNLSALPKKDSSIAVHIGTVLVEVPCGADEQTLTAVLKAVSDL